MPLVEGSGPFYLVFYDRDRVEAAKTTLAPLVAKFGVKAGGDYNANRTVPLVFWGLLVPACQMV